MSTNWFIYLWIYYILIYDKLDGNSTFQVSFLFDVCVCFEVMDELCLCFSTKSLALFPTWWVQLARSRGVSSFTASTSTAKPIYCFMNKPASNVFKELKNLLLEWLKLILTIHFLLKEVCYYCTISIKFLFLK